jgi:DNA polymerase-3 subunit delta
MASFKPAYLIHGDDHGRIGERRAALRELAERESGCSGVECFEGDAAMPEAIARALDAMTFAIGRRFLVVDGAERWKEADVKDHLAPALKAIAPDTTIAFFGRDERRFKVCPALAKAVEKAGGVVATEHVLKARDLPRWLQGEAEKLAVGLDRDGAQALVALVGERQQRLLRELEKLALELGPGARIGRDEVEGAAAAVLEASPVWLVLVGEEATAAGSTTFASGPFGARASASIAMLAAGRRVPRAPSDAGQVVRVGALELRVLWPRRDPPAPPGAEPNDRATVIHLRDGEFDLLLTADAESSVTAGLDLPAIDALKVAHHGSEDPGLADLLRRLRPRVAVIECGARNLYGHPTPATLAALAAAVPIVRRTDRDGTVRLRVHDGRMAVQGTS